MVDLMVGVVGASFLRVNTVGGSTSYIKELIKMKITSKSMTFSID